MNPVLAESWNNVSTERTAVLADVERQRQETQGFVESQTRRILDQLAVERQQLTRDLNLIAENHHTDLQKFLHEEHIALRVFLDEQREELALLVGVERAKTTDAVARIAENSVDRVYDKLWFVLVIIWIGAAGLIVIARLLFRPRKSPTASP